MKKHSLKTTLSLALGSGLEYYDFVIYGLMIKYTGAIFFSSADKYSGVMQVFVTFAIGYIMRPVGGFIFGIVADMYGRSKVIIVSMLVMTISTFSIGMLPTYEQVGILAPILLIICRLFQGISFGAELPGAITIIAESTKNKLGKMCSLVLSGTTIGSLLAMATITVISNKFNTQEMHDYMWRIPFLIGGVLAVIAYFIRRNIAETSEYLELQNTEKSLKSIINLLRINIVSILIGIGITFFMATLIITNLYFPVYISRNFSYEMSEIFFAMTNSMIASIIFMISFGWVSDYVSKLKQLLFAIIGFSISLVPLYYLLKQGTFSSLQLFFIIYQFWIAVFTSSCMPIISKLLPTSIRYTGTALIYNIAFSLASFLPPIYEYLFAAGNPAYLGCFFIFAAIIAMISLKERSRFVMND
ncbi:MAG: MFS transporter [Rickettsiales bacterium]|nr:MAG: MFS transporter [Rickettsiales bacterium]